RQIERLAGGAAGQPRRLALPAVRSQSGQILDGQRDRRRRVDERDGAVLPFFETRPQRFMAPYDLRERAPDRLDVELSLDANRVGDVVGRAVRLEAMQEPEAPLRVG